MEAKKTFGFGTKMRNAILGLSAIVLMGTAGCASKQNTYNSQSAQEQQPEVYVIEGMPASVAAECRYGPSCSLAVVLYDQNQRKQVFTTGIVGNQEGITMLEAVIEAEINDGDTEPIKVALDKNLNIDYITVEGTPYQP